MGDGRERPALEHQARTLGADAVFAGFLGERERDAALAVIDLFAMPSLGEALPLALIEAMGAGKAIVATTVGGIPEIIQDGRTGYLVPPEDHAALGHALRRVLADSTLAERLGIAARQRYLALFSAARMVETTEAAYTEAMSARRG